MVYIVDAVLVMKAGGNGVVQWGGNHHSLVMIIGRLICVAKDPTNFMHNKDTF